MLVEPAAPVVLVGPLSSDASAVELAAETAELLHRYAREVVGGFRLRPSLTQLDGGTHAICVILDHALDTVVVSEAVRATGRTVVHAVFPLARASPAELERFAREVADRLCEVAPRIVYATFHPDLAGEEEPAGELVAILRRSPDRFVQFLPYGLRDGGPSTFGITVAAAAFLEASYHGIRLGTFDALVASQRELRAERRRRYSRFTNRFGPFSW